MFAVELLVAEDGAYPFQAWFECTPPPAPPTGWTPRWSGCGAGIWETTRRLKGSSNAVIHHGPGYRIYFGRDGERLIVLIAGGTKKGQNRDIRTAQRLWREYKGRKRR